MPKSIPELRQIHEDAGLPAPVALNAKVEMGDKFEVPNGPPNQLPNRTQEQQEVVRRNVSEAVDIAYETLDTRRDIDALLEKAGKAALVIDWVIDPLAGFLPVIGDSVGSIAGIYIIQKAREAGVPKELIKKMFINLALDFGIGLVPGVGDFADLLFRANKKNVEIFRQYAQEVKRDKYRPKF
jgi:hypothetical protein